MKIITYLNFIAILFVSSSIAQNNNDDDDDDDDDNDHGFGNVGVGISNAITGIQGVAATIASIASTPNPTPTAIPTTSTTSTPTSTSSHSSTSSTSKSSSSTTSKAKASSTTSSAAKSSTAAASSKYHPNTKVGVGVGVSLGIIAVAVIGFLILRYAKHKRDSRLRHHGVIAAAGLYPVTDESDSNAGGMEQRNMTTVGNDSGAPDLEKDQVHEIQGTEIPPHSRELIGSPGLRRQELPSMPGSV